VKDYPANNFITGLTNTVEENPFRGHQLIVDSINSNRDEDYEEREEVEEPEQGYEIQKVDQVIEIVPSRTPVYETISPAGEPVENSADIQLKALYEGEGVSPPHYDERGPMDGAESEAGDEEDEEEGFHQQNFVTNELLFTQTRTDFVTEHRETINLETTNTHEWRSTQQHMEPQDEEDQREAEGQL
jgi:hypothetical protein